MARKKPVDERVRAFVASVFAERPEQEDEYIDAIEHEMEELADAVADEFASQLLAWRWMAVASNVASGSPRPRWKKTKPVGVK